MAGVAENLNLKLEKRLSSDFSTLLWELNFDCYCYALIVVIYSIAPIEII